jgi:hypothetical protein
MNKRKKINKKISYINTNYENYYYLFNIHLLKKKKKINT